MAIPTTILLYTAWDNRRDETIFTKGINILLDAGIKPNHIMVYMLCGYWKWETWDDILYRFNKMVAIGLMPYPMVYGSDDGNQINKKELKKFQRWAVRRIYQFTEWDFFKNENEAAYYSRKYSQDHEENLFS